MGQKVSSLFFEEEITDEDVLRIELDHSTPIVGITMTPKVHLKYECACIFRWDRINVNKPHETTKDPKDDLLKRASGIPVNPTEQTQFLSQSIKYTPTEYDVNQILQFSCTAIINSEGITKTVRTKHVIPFPSPPKPREFQIVQMPQKKSTKPTSVIESLAEIGLTSNESASKFTVVTYNLLAQMNAHPQSFTHCDAFVLSWDYRKKVLLNELLALDSDILCLQEVDMCEFDDFWEMELSRSGYSSLFPPKDHLCRQDDTFGCAIFFKRFKFYKLKEWIIPFDVAFQNSEQMKNLFKREGITMEKMESNSYALVLQLEFKDKRRDMPSRILIANTHISKAESPACIIPLTQTYILLQTLQQILNVEKENDKVMPTVICGDFNNDKTSRLYEFLMNKGVKEMQKPSVDKNASDDVPKPTSPLLPTNQSSPRDSTFFVHSLNLQSAYKNVFGEEPMYKRGSDKKVAATEFIWYTPNNTVVTKALKLPKEDYIYPCLEYPSSHCALMCEFDIHEKQKDEEQTM